MWLLKTPVAGNGARQWLLIALSHVLLYDVKRNFAANKAHFWDCCHNMGHFRCGVERVKCYVNPHLHCIVSSLKLASKMSTLPINGKFSVNANACVVYVYNVTSALYCAINNHFCVIRGSFVATSQLACRWMCDSSRTGCAWRLTPTNMRREYAKTKAHKHGRMEDFFQWGPLGDISKIFLGGKKCWNLIFPTRNEENNLLLLKFWKSRGVLAPCPPSDAHAHIYVKYVTFKN